MGETPTMEEVMFDMTDGLCRYYQALSPFEVLKTSFVEVIELYADVRKKQIRDKRNEKFEDWVPASDSAGWW